MLDDRTGLVARPYLHDQPKCDIWLLVDEIIHVLKRPKRFAVFWRSVRKIRHRDPRSDEVFFCGKRWLHVPPVSAMSHAVGRWPRDLAGLISPPIFFQDADGLGNRHLM